MSLYIKACGFKNYDTIRCAIDEGASAIGFVLTDSSRKVTLKVAERLAEKINSFVETFAVVKNPSRSLLVALSKTDCFTAIQHYEPLPDFLKEKMIEKIRAYQFSDYLMDKFSLASSSRLLIDSPCKSGSGIQWDYSRINKLQNLDNIILAGGISVNNIEKILTNTKVKNIDISSGLEIEKGIKSVTKIQAFFRECKNIVESKL